MISSQRSKVDHPSVVVEEMAAIFGNFLCDNIRVLDVPQPQFFEDQAEAVIPSLFLLRRLAGIRRA